MINREMNQRYLLVKFNCSNRTEVALVAQRLGLDSAPPKAM